MSKYFETKKGSLEDMVAGVTKGKQSEDYKQLFKKELEKAGKGIGAMSDQEKKDFFNKIDKKHTAKNEDSKKVQKMNVKKSSGEKLKEETELDEKKQYHMYSTKAAAEKKAKEIGGKVEKSTAAHFQGYYAVKEETEAKSIEQSIMDVWNSAAGEQIKREDDAKWLKTEEKKKLVEEKIKCPNCGHMNEPGTKKCTNCGYDLSKAESKDTKKKALTGTPATKVDTEPEAEIDIK